MNLIIIIFSLIVSTALSVFIMRNRKSKWLGMLSTFVINMIMLGGAYGLFYNFDEEFRLFGTDTHARYILVMCIPVMTWINFMIISVVRNRDIKAEASHQKAAARLK
ncbi:hypothetical protein [Paenibacillus gorillae]|uniref:hypothetical protein n=1 Tax=Paenibacillus gorillae TaxID=1243662 RepID=UPI0005A95732|nr:hypothetical protein [Paenibacillus gorillae]